jgi:hypothetical protein
VRTRSRGIPHAVGQGEMILISCDMIIESPARVPHRLANDGAETFRVLVVKVPKPTKVDEGAVTECGSRAA